MDALYLYMKEYNFYISPSGPLTLFCAAELAVTEFYMNIFHPTFV